MTDILEIQTESMDPDVLVLLVHVTATLTQMLSETATGRFPAYNTGWSKKKVTINLSLNHINAC